MRQTLQTYPPKDGGWGWFVVLGAGIVSFFIGGFIRAFSLIFEEIRIKFGSSASAAAWVPSINVTMALVFGPLSTMLATRFSVRKVAMAGSVLMLIGYSASAYTPNLQLTYFAFAIAGVGQGFLYTPALLIISHWFDKRRAKATSIGLMMDGFGSLVMAPLLRYLLDHYGYSGTMLIVSAIMANNFIVAALFREPDEMDYTKASETRNRLHQVEMQNENHNEVTSDEEVLRKDADGKVYANSELLSDETTLDYKATNENGLGKAVHKPDLVSHEVKSKDCSQKILKYFDYRLFRMGHYLTFSLLMSCASLCFSMCNTHIAGLAIESNFSASQISLLLAAMGGSNTCARFLSGFLFDNAKVCKFRIHLLSCFGLIIASSLLISPWIKHIVGFFAIWLIYIMAVGVFATQESIILADIVGRDRFSSAIGINRFFRGMGVLIGPTVGGYLKDYTGVYDYTFIFGGLCFLVSLTLFELSVIIVQRRHNSK